MGDDMEPVLQRAAATSTRAAWWSACWAWTATRVPSFPAPDIPAHGVLTDAGSDYIEEAKDAVRQALEGQSQLNWSQAREVITVTLKRFFKKRLGRRPVIMPAVMEL